MMRGALLIYLLVSCYCSFAQTDIPRGWHLMDYQMDKFYGISLNKAYSFLKEKIKRHNL